MIVLYANLGGKVDVWTGKSHLARPSMWIRDSTDAVRYEQNAKGFRRFVRAAAQASTP